MNFEGIKEQALMELEQEERRKLIEAEKVRIIEMRNRKKYLFPWRIRVVNLNKGEE